ncbi:MAG: hypothetical protein ACOYM2_20705 [Rectinemataceae bacterium]
MMSPEHFMPVFEELETECRSTIQLIEALKERGISEDRREDLIGDLSASITSLKIQTNLLDEELEAIDTLVL